MLIEIDYGRYEGRTAGTWTIAVGTFEKVDLSVPQYCVGGGGGGSTKAVALTGVVNAEDDAESRANTRCIADFPLLLDACRERDVRIAELETEVQTLRAKVSTADQYHASIDEALNMGDGSYRP